MDRKPHRIYIATIPQQSFVPFLPNGVSWIRGQLELGANGFLHWQIVCHFSKPIRISGIKTLMGSDSHWEPTRSEASEQYVWKEETRIDGTQFELGTKPLKRNSPTDWNVIRDQAKRGDLDSIPADIYIRSYMSLKRIAGDHMEPVALERIVHVFWGSTGTGKSRRAWSEGGLDAYPKDPRTKFWDGYRGQDHVIIDEFRGGIDISHMLRWLDRYPVIVEVKGSSVVLKAKIIWITSNLDPRRWYPDVDQSTLDALMRRLNITYFP